MEGADTLTTLSKSAPEQRLLWFETRTSPSYTACSATRCAHPQPARCHLDPEVKSICISPHEYSACGKIRPLKGGRAQA